LIHQDDEDWQESCLRVITYFSSVWGGAHNLLVPTDGKGLEKIFWDILFAYDADYIFYYYKTIEDLKTIRPVEYNSWVEAELRAFGGNQDSNNRTRQQIEDFAGRRNLTPDITPEFSQEIRTRLAPFHMPNNVVYGIVTATPPRLPLAPIPRVLSGSDERPGLAVFNPSYQGFYPLWLASVTGMADAKLRQELNQLGTSAHEFETGDHSIDLVISERERDALTTQRNLAAPFQLTDIKLGAYQSVKSSLLYGPMTVVAGETLSDFCLYYSLARLRPPVLWLPHTFFKSEAANSGSTTLFDLFAGSLKARLREIVTTPKAIFNSYSLDAKQLESLREDLDRARGFSMETLKETGEVSFDIRRFVSHPIRMFESGNASRPTSLIVDNSLEIELFETPKPKHYPKLDPHEHRWITDVIVSGHYLPRNPILGEWAIRSPILGTYGARIGSGTFSYFCPNIGYAGGDIDSVLVRPTLFVPSPIQIFERIFWSIGYESKLSDKGLFAQEAVSKFGGLEELGSFLQEPLSRELLFKFLDRSKTANLSNDGCLLKDQRRYLPFPCISKILGGDAAGQKTIESLISRGILHRGCIFKCRSCRNADWFALDEFSQTFRCKRCGATQFASSETYWYGEYEPGWFYKLDEIIYQYLAHNGYVSSLALEYMRKKSEDSFLFTGDLELVKLGSTSQKPEFELDIVAVVDGDIVLGEAKKPDKLENKEIKKYEYLARKIGAKKLVFVTFAEMWSDETLTLIKNIIDTQTVELTTLTKSDLL